MKQGWELLPFGEVCKLEGGSQPPKSEFIYEPKEGYIRLVQVRDYKTDKFETYIPISKAKKFCTASDIMIGRYGPPIFGIFGGIEGAFNVALMKATPDENLVNKDYFRWFLKDHKLVKFVEKTSKRAAGQDGVRKERLYSYNVPIPPLEDQKQIVKILDEAFEAIDQAQANINKNIENAQELFQSKLNDIFSQKDEGWEEKLWNDILEIRSGRNQKAVQNPNGKYPILGSAGKVMGYADDFICEENTTIVGRKGTINNPMLIQEKFWNVDTAFGLHAKDTLNKFYLFYFCKSFDFEKMDRGSGRPSLVKSDLLKIKMPVPSLKTQQKIVEELESLQQKTKSLEELCNLKLSNLEDLKKSILQKAFAGELTNN